MADPRRIAAAMVEVERFVRLREEALISEIVSRYRGGMTEHDFVVGKMAELSAGRYLLTEMRRSLTQESKNV